MLIHATYPLNAPRLLSFSTLQAACFLWGVSTRPAEWVGHCVVSRAAGLASAETTLIQRSTSSTFNSTLRFYALKFV